METQITTSDRQLAVEDADMEQVMDMFIGSLDIGQKSKDTYRLNIRPYIKWLKDNDRSGTDRKDILDFKKDMEQTHTASTVSSYLAVVRVFYRYLESEKIMPNIATGIKGLPTQGHRKEPFTVDDVRKILESMPRNTINEVRNYAMVNLMIRTGLRTVEVIRADIEDLGMTNGVRTLKVQGKGRHEKDQTVVLTESAYQPIKEYLKARGKYDKKDPLFISHAHRNNGARLDTRTVRSVGKQAMKDAEVIDEGNSHLFTCHSFRHTAVDLVVGELGITKGQELARHSSPETTLIYWHARERVSQNAPEFALDRLLKGQ